MVITIVAVATLREQWIRCGHCALCDTPLSGIFGGLFRTARCMQEFADGTSCSPLSQRAVLTEGALVDHWLCIVCVRWLSHVLLPRGWW